MKLTEKLELRNIDYAVNPKSLNNLSGSYKFLYESNYKVSLRADLVHVGYTESFKPVFNFGYSVDIEKFSKREMSYTWLEGLDEESGQSTKKYFSDVESRKSLVQVLKRYVAKRLSQFSLPVIVRGPMNEFKQTSSRYLQIDEVIQSFGYQRIVVPVSSMKGYLPAKHKIDELEKDVYWIYSKTSLEPSEYTNLIRT